jgi:hypothetical protein
MVEGELGTGNKGFHDHCAMIGHLSYRSRKYCIEPFSFILCPSKSVHNQWYEWSKSIPTGNSCDILFLCSATTWWMHFVLFASLQSTPLFINTILATF